MTEVATTADSPASTDLRNTILAVQQWLNHGLVGRKKEIKSVLLTLLAGENIVLIGPPGTAKSLLARRISQVVAQPDDGSAPYFEYLLTKFSTPEELFGPLSIAELKQDRFRRNTAGYLPTVQVAFLDEIFKASSSILNALLTVLNERAYHNGAQAEKIPLQALVAASNELPTGDSELAALYDRFLLRHYVGYLDEQERGELFALSDADAESDDNAGNNAGNNATPPHRFSADALHRLRQQAQRVRFPAEIQKAMQTLWEKHANAFQDNALEQLSDRRFVKLQQLLRVSAATNGRDAVDMSDLMLLKDCLWNSDANRHTVRELIIKVLHDAVGAADAESVGKSTVADDSISLSLEDLSVEELPSFNPMHYEGFDELKTLALLEKHYSHLDTGNGIIENNGILGLDRYGLGAFFTIGGKLTLNDVYFFLRGLKLKSCYRRWLDSAKNNNLTVEEVNLNAESFISRGLRYAAVNGYPERFADGGVDMEEYKRIKGIDGENIEITHENVFSIDGLFSAGKKHRKDKIAYFSIENRDLKKPLPPSIRLRQARIAAGLDPDVEDVVEIEPESFTANDPHIKLARAGIEARKKLLEGYKPTELLKVGEDNHETITINGKTTVSLLEQQLQNNIWL